MHASAPLFIAALLVLSCGTYANAQSSASITFSANLRLGSEGVQVVALQKILNQDSDTRIADTGPGSPGYETSYFGSLTQTAVVRFQEKYARETLSPAGLVRGTGFVGMYTRTKLNSLSAPQKNTENATSVITTPSSIPSVSVAPTNSGQTTASQNPNLKNLDVFLAATDKAAVKQGFSAAEIAIIKEQILKQIATTTDLRSTFLGKVPVNSNQTAQNTSLSDRILTTIARTFTTFFMPERARAATGVPFGGALLYALPCNGGVWNLDIEPLPPTFVAVLSYISGSQAFLSYNIPATHWLLGEYVPGAGSCWIGHYYIPSEGNITPVVGSSPI